MNYLHEALNELGIEQWILRGFPTNETEFTQMFSKVVGVDANNSAIESKDPADWGFTYAEVEAKAAELEAAQPLKDLRAERDKLLAETDWWAMSDRTMTAEQTSYRQTLRDITDTYSSLDDVVWPVKP